MDLGAEMEQMSWRRFCALLGGLSPASTTVTLMSVNNKVYEGAEAEEMARRFWR